MKNGMIVAIIGLGVTGMASATWTDFYVTKTQTSNSGINLDVYQLFARFNGPTDTVLNAFNLDRTTSSGILNGFYPATMAFSRPALVAGHHP